MCVSVGSGCINISNRTVISSVPAAHSKHRHTHTHSQSKAWRQTHTHTHACAHTRSQINTNRHSDTHTGRVSVVHFDNALCVKETWRSKSLSKKKKKNCRKTHTHTNSGKHCVEVRDGEQEWQTRGVKFQTLCVCVFVYPVSALYGTTQTQTQPIRAEVTVLQALYWPTVERHVGSSSDNGVCVWRLALDLVSRSSSQWK